MPLHFQLPTSTLGLLVTLEGYQVHALAALAVGERAMGGVCASLGGNCQLVREYHTRSAHGAYTEVVA